MCLEFLSNQQEFKRKFTSSEFWKTNLHCACGLPATSSTLSDPTILGCHFSREQLNLWSCYSICIPNCSPIHLCQSMQDLKQKCIVLVSYGFLYSTPPPLPVQNLEVVSSVFNIEYVFDHFQPNKKVTNIDVVPMLKHYTMKTCRGVDV
jgi:hypothetical protein